MKMKIIIGQAHQAPLINFHRTNQSRVKVAANFSISQPAVEMKQFKKDGVLWVVIKF